MCDLCFNIMILRRNTVTSLGIDVFNCNGKYSGKQIKCAV
jgi:hypothetical protein